MLLILSTVAVAAWSVLAGAKTYDEMVHQQSNLKRFESMKLVIVPAISKTDSIHDLWLKKIRSLDQSHYNYNKTISDYTCLVEDLRAVENNLASSKMMLKPCLGASLSGCFWTHLSGRTSPVQVQLNKTTEQLGNHDYYAARYAAAVKSVENARNDIDRVLGKANK